MVADTKIDRYFEPNCYTHATNSGWAETRK